jgi:hypothetical protein
MKELGSYLSPGTRVRYDGTGEPEYGIVVHCWINDEIQAYNCYIAFFGEQLPAGAPKRYPVHSAVRFDVSRSCMKKSRGGYQLCVGTVAV